MLVEMAIFDAVGAGYEYTALPLDGPRLSYRQHPRHPLPPGCYTDDTQMALALARLMTYQDPDIWTTYDIAGAFLRTFCGDPREGYAQGFFDFLTRMRQVHLESGPDAAVVRFLKEIRPDSDKSGAAMRAPPIGLLGSISEVLRIAALQARVTHDTAGGIASAQASALMTHYCYHGLGSLADLPAFLHEHVPGHPWSTPWVGKVGQQGMSSTRAALTVLCRATSLSEALLDCVRFTGDVDTVAAICGPAATLSSQVDNDLPQHLYDGLEQNGPTKSELYLVQKQLLAQYRRRGPA